MEGTELKPTNKGTFFGFAMFFFSQACLGKMIVCTYKVDAKCRFLTELFVSAEESEVAIRAAAIE